MNKKNYFSVAGGLFLLIALVHLTRVVQGWDANIGAYDVPVWLSWAAVIVGGFMAYQGLVKHRRG
jgi:hypothetical protein